MEQLNTIRREELKAKLDRGDDFLLVEVSDRASYGEAHLPGAAHFQSLEELEKSIPDRGHELVLYAENLRDHGSLHVVRELTGMGYPHVYEYEAGKEDWIENNLPTEPG
ncbi:rhodanese-like domain-containing protein [Rubrobacter indicoceani]|uniref:rhodanese-like domain-containing protein n=1 Tax=Rubrobacter indicoceani TaxID=2051957 RepID=UPI000E5A36E9|nr:rhodanese-like domain-containing protein [Rubrobacter indicoceani]